MRPQRPPLFSRRWIVLGILAAIAIGLIVLSILTSHHTNKPKDGTATSYTDPYSHETVSTIIGKGPDNAGGDPNIPLILGLSSLLNYGVSTDQIASFQNAWKAYSLAQPSKIKEVSIHVDNISAVPHNSQSSSTVDSLSFDVTVDRKTTYHTRLDYFDLSEIRMVLTNDKNATVYDSGTFDPNSGED